MIKLLDEKGKNYIIHGGDNNIKLDPNPCTKSVSYVCTRPSDARLITISILYLI